MTPKLHESTETEYRTNGIGPLADALSCTVTEVRNGEYILSMTYPVTGVWFEEIKNDRIILAKPNETSRDQPFRISSISTPINGVVTVSGEHISYQLADIPVFPFSASSISAALTGLKNNSVTDNPFSFWTDKTSAGNFAVSAPASVRSRLMGNEGSILDVYGTGDYEFDRYEVKLHANRGLDNGVSIEYGKNLTDVKQEENIANLISGIAPFWADDETTVTLPEKIIAIENNYGYTRIQPVDFSGDFETAPTVAQLRAAANSYLANSSLTTPKISISVSFVPLWQTENYKENPLYQTVAALERVSLCDTVKVKYAKLGIEATAKVVKTVYDVLAERYNTIDIGEPRVSSVERAVQQQLALNNTPSKSFLEKAILNATNAITGATGGYVVLDPPKNPQQILIMDTPDKSTALRVWRWNLNGLGYSSNGVNGPFGLAMTMDGAIVANYITSGVLNANIIKAGVIEDAAGKNHINMTTGDVSMQGVFETISGSLRTRLEAGTIAIYNGSTLVGRFEYSANMGVRFRGNGLELIDASGTVQGTVGVDSGGNAFAWLDNMTLDGSFVQKRTATVGGTTINYLGW